MKIIGKIVFLTLLGIFLAAPLVVVAGVSFNGTQRMNFPPQNVSLIWYEAFFNDPAWMSAFSLSLTVASLAALTSVRQLLFPNRLFDLEISVANRGFSLSPSPASRSCCPRSCCRSRSWCSGAGSAMSGGSRYDPQPRRGLRRLPLATHRARLPLRRSGAG